MFADKHQLYPDTLYFHHQQQQQQQEYNFSFTTSPRPPSTSHYQAATTTACDMVDEDLLRAALEAEKAAFPQGDFDVLGVNDLGLASVGFVDTIVTNDINDHPLLVKDSFHLLGHDFVDFLHQTTDKLHSLVSPTHLHHHVATGI